MSVAGLACGMRLKSNYKPKKVESQNATRLEFENGDFNLFYINGAIVWPSGMYPGFAIIAGQELKSGTVLLLEELEFESVRTMVVGHGEYRSREEGFGKWAEDMNKRFHCERFFWSGRKADQVHRKYHKEVIRNPQVKFRPRFLRVPYADNSDNIDRLIYDMERRGTLFGKVDSQLHMKTQMVRADPKSEMGLVGWNCLRNMVAGLKRYPWKPAIGTAPGAYMIKVRMG